MNATLIVSTPEGERRFEVPVEIGMTILDALLHVQEEQDPTLSLNWNCRTAQCGLCAVRVDGTPRLACVEKALPGQTYRLEPVLPERHVQGLVCEVSDLYRQFFLDTAERGKERRKKAAFENLLLG